MPSFEKKLLQDWQNLLLKLLKEWQAKWKMDYKTQKQMIKRILEHFALSPAHLQQTSSQLLILTWAHGILEEPQSSYKSRSIIESLIVSRLRPFASDNILLVLWDIRFRYFDIMENLPSSVSDILSLCDTLIRLSDEKRINSTFESMLFDMFQILFEEKEYSKILKVLAKITATKQLTFEQVLMYSKCLLATSKYSETVNFLNEYSEKISSVQHAKILKNTQAILNLIYLETIENRSFALVPNLNDSGSRSSSLNSRSSLGSKTNIDVKNQFSLSRLCDAYAVETCVTIFETIESSLIPNPASFHEFIRAVATEFSQNDSIVLQLLEFLVNRKDIALCNSIIKMPYFRLRIYWFDVFRQLWSCDSYDNAFNKRSLKNIILLWKSHEAQVEQGEKNLLKACKLYTSVKFNPIFMTRDDSFETKLFDFMIFISCTQEDPSSWIDFYGAYMEHIQEYEIAYSINLMYLQKICNVRTKNILNEFEALRRLFQTYCKTHIDNQVYTDIKSLLSKTDAEIRKLLGRNSSKILLFGIAALQNNMINHLAIVDYLLSIKDYLCFKPSKDVSLIDKQLIFGNDSLKVTETAAFVSVACKLGRQEPTRQDDEFMPCGLLLDAACKVFTIHDLVPENWYTVKLFYFDKHGKRVCEGNTLIVLSGEIIFPELSINLLLSILREKKITDGLKDLFCFYHDLLRVDRLPSEITEIFLEELWKWSIIDENAESELTINWDTKCDLDDSLTAIIFQRCMQNEDLLKTERWTGLLEYSLAYLLENWSSFGLDTTANLLSASIGLDMGQELKSRVMESILELVTKTPQFQIQRLEVRPSYPVITKLNLKDLLAYVKSPLMRLHKVLALEIVNDGVFSIPHYLNELSLLELFQNVRINGLKHTLRDFSRFRNNALFLHYYVFLVEYCIESLADIDILIDHMYGEIIQLQNQNMKQVDPLGKYSFDIWKRNGWKISNPPPLNIPPGFHFRKRSGNRAVTEAGEMSKEDAIRIIRQLLPYLWKRHVHLRNLKSYLKLQHQDLPKLFLFFGKMLTEKLLRTDVGSDLIKVESRLCLNSARNDHHPLKIQVFARKLSIASEVHSDSKKVIDLDILNALSTAAIFSERNSKLNFLKTVISYAWNGLVAISNSSSINYSLVTPVLLIAQSFASHLNGKDIESDTSAMYFLKFSLCFLFQTRRYHRCLELTEMLLISEVNSIKSEAFFWKLQCIDSMGSSKTLFSMIHGEYVLFQKRNTNSTEALDFARRQFANFTVDKDSILFDSVFNLFHVAIELSVEENNYMNMLLASVELADIYLNLQKLEKSKETLLFALTNLCNSATLEDTLSKIHLVSLSTEPLLVPLTLFKLSLTETTSKKSRLLEVADSIFVDILSKSSITEIVSKNSYTIGIFAPFSSISSFITLIASASDKLSPITLEFICALGKIYTETGLAKMERQITKTNIDDF